MRWEEYRLTRAFAFPSLTRSPASRPTSFIARARKRPPPAAGPPATSARQTRNASGARLIGKVLARHGRGRALKSVHLARESFLSPLFPPGKPAHLNEMYEPLESVAETANEEEEEALLATYLGTNDAKVGSKHATARTSLFISAPERPFLDGRRRRVSRETATTRRETGLARADAQTRSLPYFASHFFPFT